MFPLNIIIRFFSPVFRTFVPATNGHSAPQSQTLLLPDGSPIDTSHFEPLCHPRVKEVSEEVDGYFLQHWPFENEKARKKFLAAGFSRVTCLYFPKSLDDRIHFGCRLLTVLFLIDDLLEDMTFEEGEAYNNHLMPLMRGVSKPNRQIPVEYIMYDLWESMRAHDHELAEEILEPVFTFMRAQTDRTRVGLKQLGPYLEYRERDVGKALLSALMRFCMGLRLSAAELDTVRQVERNCSKHISVINDIWSWEKEYIASKIGNPEGSALCSSVQVMAEEANLSFKASKRVLYAMSREWELIHNDLVKKRTSQGACTPDLSAYMEGLEYQMSGNELWSRTTLRYVGVAEN